MERVILHCDCNSFYSSVELLRHPELKTRPVAVSGSTDNRHGIILAKNEAAKRYKVQTAETVWQAKQKCPDLILLPPHWERYHHYSKLINDLYGSYTDRVEPFGIDESWLDITGSWQLFANSPLEVANRIRREVREKTGLTVSVGVSFNKVFAKLGSDYKKPDATTEISRENYRDIVWPLPTAALIYIGRKSQKALADIGIATLGQLAQADPALLTHVMGKAGMQAYEYANGNDGSPVARIGEREPVKSIGNGLTFRRDLLGYRDIRSGVGGLADEVATRLREKKLYATNLQVLVKDPALKSISRQKSLPYATNLAKDLTTAAMQLMRDNWDFKKPVRMLTVTAQNLTDMPFAEQTNLFGQQTGLCAKREKLELSLDEIREKFGRGAIVEGALLHNDIGFSQDDTDENWAGELLNND